MVTHRGNWRKLRIASISLVFATIISLIGCNAPTYVPAPVQSSPSSTPTPSLTTLPTPVKSPLLTITLDYFGIRNTHWMPQIGGDSRAKIQLLMVIFDQQQTLVTRLIPPAGIPGFDMDFFQVKAIKDSMDPEVFTGSATGSLTVYFAAYNVNKGLVTQAQIDIIAKWLGLPDLDILKGAIPDRELVGYYWHTWSPSSNWGIGRYDEQGDEEDFKVWLRIGSGQMPEPVQQPVLKPNVQIEDVKLPTGVRVRQPSEQYQYKVWDFAFTIANNESFSLPLYWHLESSHKPETKVFPYDYPTEGTQTVPGDGKVTTKAQYWFTKPGSYLWKYVAEYPKGNPIASWTGTLIVSP